MENVNLNVSKYLRIYKLNEDNYVLWNSFFPNFLKINKNGYLAIKSLESENVKKKSIESLAPFIDNLVRYKILYIGKNDTCRNEFITKLDQVVEKSNQKAIEFYEKRLAYTQIYIFNTSCNLKCSYCVRNFKPGKKRYPLKASEKEKIFDSVIDQYIMRNVDEGLDIISISLNGGECFLEWNLIKSFMIKTKKKYPGLKFKYYFNTNMTLMTEEISKFLSNYDIDFSISIDGYSEAHDRNRIYQNGKGSFSNVLKGLEIYNKYNPNNPIKNFQGTVDKSDGFEPEKVYELKKYGFESARLGPNLLDISEEDVFKKIEIYKKFLILNQANDFKVSDSFIDKMVETINKKEYSFVFTCNGLGCLPRPSIYFNLTAMTFSHICSYCPNAEVPVNELNFDIYNPKLWEVSYQFIKDRAESLKKNCMECEFIGICMGDCIMLGLDNENKLNQKACLFKKELWNFFLNLIFNMQEEDNQFKQKV